MPWTSSHDTYNSCAADGGCHGAARGIGAAVARRLAGDGLAVGVIDLDEAECADTVEAITSVGGAALAVAADVADEAAVTAAIARIAAAFGPPTVLVNNAGIGPRAGLVDMTTQQWDTVLGINLSGPFFVTRAVCPHMVAAVGDASSTCRASPRLVMPAVWITPARRRV